MTGHSAVQIKDAVWVCGGEGGKGRRDHVWRLNLDTLVWSQVKCPTGLHRATISYRLRKKDRHPAVLKGGGSVNRIQR